MSGLALLLVVASAGLLQSGPSPLPEPGNLTASAILGWYAWHTATKTIPGLVGQFRDALAEHRAALREQSEAFRQELAAERAVRHADQTATVAALHQLTQQLVVSFPPSED